MSRHSTIECPDDPEVPGLIALMLLHDARRITRFDDDGDIVLLEQQDRSRWDRLRISEATVLLERAFSSGTVGAYTLQAAIAAAHAAAPTVASTNWVRIVDLYDLLIQADPSPLVALNRAVAIGRRDGPEAGLIAVERALESGGLDRYALAHAARAGMQRELGQVANARESYEQARRLTRHPDGLRFVEAQLQSFQ